MLMTSPSNIFERGCFGFGAFGEEFNEDVYHRLSQLPEYVKVYAAVSFPEDLTMEELIAFSDSLKDGEVCWIGIRHVEENGVHTYGCYVTASPKTMLGLLDSGEITQAYLADVWLDF